MTTEGSYQLLDTGDRRKLERFGPLTVDRPSPQAVWSRRLHAREWADADAVFVRGQGWENPGDAFPDDWRVTVDDVTLKLRPEANGQVGVFPEQLDGWRWVRDTVAQAGRPIRVLNGFAYTGAASLFAAAAGAEVCHVDAAKAAVTTARKNAEASGLGDRPIRWIVDDMVTFMAKEVKRGRIYDGIILDPPAFGRAKNGKTWTRRTQMPVLLDLTEQLLSETPLFVLLTCHDPEISAAMLGRMLHGPTRTETGELSLGGVLPSGVFARWRT